MKMVADRVSQAAAHEDDRLVADRVSQAAAHEDDRLTHAPLKLVASAVAGVRECSMRKSAGKPRFGYSDLLYEQVRIPEGRLAKAHPH